MSNLKVNVFNSKTFTFQICEVSQVITSSIDVLYFKFEK